MDYNKIPNYFEDEKDSRKKAKDTLIKIFENKMLNIDTIKTIINEFHKFENQNSIEVFNRIERNINESDVSTKKISDIITNISEVDKSTSDFFKGWEKVTAQINYYGKNLENLMLSKKNVSITRHNLNIYVKIKDQINELRDAINANDSNIVAVYKQIRYLAYLRRALLEKVKKVTRTDRLNNLADHLLCVQQFEEEFFTKFWKYFEVTIDLAVSRPEFLIKLLRLIEEDAEYMRNIKNQFQMYSKSDEKFQGLDTINSAMTAITRESQRESNLNPDPDGDTLPEILLLKIEEQLEEKFHQTFVDKKDLKEILDATLVLVNDLVLVQSKVQQCFPPKYNIFNLYKEVYLRNIYNKIKPFMNENDLKQSPGNLILIAKWLDQFDEILRKVGIEIKTTEIGSDVEYYMHLFYDHVNEILTENIDNIISKNLEDKSKLRSGKVDLDKLQSFYATDIFKSLFNVIHLLSGDIKGQLLFQICKVVIDKLQDIQKSNDKLLEDLSEANDLIVSCVYILDANNCLEILPDFKKKIKKILQKEFYERLKVFFQNTQSLFNQTTRIGCSKAIELMFINIEKMYLRKLFTYLIN
jgi:hypothetical protein